MSDQRERDGGSERNTQPFLVRDVGRKVAAPSRDATDNHAGAAYIAGCSLVRPRDVIMSSSAGGRLSPRRWLASVYWPAAAKAFVGVVGLALLAVGAVKSVSVAGDTGAIALVLAGAVLLVSPFIVDRVQRVSVSATSVDLWLVGQVSELGAPKAAQILQRTTLGSFAESYALVHDELTGPDYRKARIHLQDLLVERAAGIARRERFEAREVRRVFASGSLVVRVLALGLMQGDWSLADVGTITAAVQDGRSRNEQYQGLQLAKLCWPRLSTAERQEVRRAIGQTDLEADSGRWRKAQEVLSLPDFQPNNHGG